MSATYSSDTYSSETYDTGEAPVKKHSFGPVIFEWATVNEVKPAEELAPIVQREIELQQAITVKVHKVLKARHSIAKLQRHVFKSVQSIARHGLSLTEIVRRYQELKAYRDQADKQRDAAYKLEQARDNTGWWASGGYCFCSKFSGVHSIKTCGREARLNDE